MPKKGEKMELKTKICRCMHCNREFPEEQIERIADDVSCGNCTLSVEGSCDDGKPEGCDRFDPAETCPFCGTKGLIADVGAESVEFVGKVVSIGNSLGIYMTKELKALGVQRGDDLKVTLKRIR